MRLLRLLLLLLVTGCSTTRDVSIQANATTWCWSVAINVQVKEHQ